MNKTIREVSISIGFDEDDFSYNTKFDYTTSDKKPKYSREKLLQWFETFLDDIEELVKEEENEKETNGLFRGFTE